LIVKLPASVKDADNAVTMAAIASAIATSLRKAFIADPSFGAPARGLIVGRTVKSRLVMSPGRILG
jgi:hypothetical protein